MKNLEARITELEKIELDKKYKKEKEEFNKKYNKLVKILGVEVIYEYSFIGVYCVYIKKNNKILKTIYGEIKGTNFVYQAPVEEKAIYERLKENARIISLIPKDVITKSSQKKAKKTTNIKK